MSSHGRWLTRPETGPDFPLIRAITLAAFDTALEADLVEALRAGPAWIDGLSIVATNADGEPVAHALLTRCHIDRVPALCLAPCSVHPYHQRSGAGTAAIRAALQAAADLDERYVTVLGHPDYYPRFGFTRASTHGVAVGFDVPDEALMVLALEPGSRLPSGSIRYPAAFGI
jgi:predicted N-acetyltransferase YhbS